MGLTLKIQDQKHSAVLELSPVRWKFKERMAMSLKYPTELPILVIKDADGMPLEQLIERISSDIFDAYGLRVANVTRTKTPEPVWLDDGLSI